MLFAAAVLVKAGLQLLRKQYLGTEICKKVGLTPESVNGGVSGKRWIDLSNQPGLPI